MNLLKQTAVLICGFMMSLIPASTDAEVVVVVSAQSLVSKLTKTQLTDIFLGKLHHLPNGIRVVPVDQAAGSPAHNEFYRNYAGRSASQIKAYWSKLIFTGRGRPPQSLSDDAAVAEFIAGNPKAIGYLESGLVNDQLKVVEIE